MAVVALWRQAQMDVGKLGWDRRWIHLAEGLYSLTGDAYPSDRVMYRVHETQDTLTLAQLEENSRRSASVLVEQLGIGVGDVVTIFALNSIQYLVAFLRCLAAEAFASPIAHQKYLDVKALVSRVQSVDTKLLITDRTLYPTIKEVAALCENIRVVSIDNNTDVPCMEQLMAHGDPAFNAFHLDTVYAAESHTAMIFRTSGSTGVIKSVLMPHLHWNVNTLTTALTVPEDTNSGKRYVDCHTAFRLQIPVIILLQPFNRTALSLIDTYNITFLFVTPPLAVEIAKNDVHGSFDSIKWLLSTGAPIHTSIREAIQHKFHETRLALEWASTETLLIALQFDGVPYPPGSSGSLVNGMEARVGSLQTGEELGPNEKGEILVRNSLCKFAGYLNNAAAINGFDVDGWYHSGDVGYIDENSNVFIIDRVKQFLRVGDGYGTHLVPGELEAALFDHPAVGMAVVVGIRNEATQLEHPTAFVVLRTNYVLGKSHIPDLAAELQRFVEVKLGTFKRLSGGVYFVEKYPQTGFKVDRRMLASLADPKTAMANPAGVIKVAMA
ncbi:acetyl-CoA synthetase-like protein [Macroventuria anomochaeta]|uniref:Acetyl-CoA synthetase-like protein n=1 Tax=Macroventuria anomochaeta TaxID=301207 RepID=A0ACB6RHW1_9PLEO|nr:acetyl-CoA synthetase-like protein [Macroventuria anomochaeta]KAF2621481.1 acetyl-CoA synthetase-like protein [Macroventuria anomochaeta]